MIYDVVILGGGPAGLAAAVEAKKDGAENVLILERDRELGGILNQCIHNGFGLSLIHISIHTTTLIQRTTFFCFSFIPHSFLSFYTIYFFLIFSQ